MPSRTLTLLAGLWPQIPPVQRRRLTQLLPLAALVAALDLLLIVAISVLVQVMLQGGGIPIQRQVLLVLALSWGLSLARSLFRQRQYQLAASVARGLMDRVLEILLHQPYSFHLQRDRSGLGRLLLHQLPQLSGQVLMPAVQAVGNAATVLLLCAGLLLLAGPGALAVIALVVLSYALLAQAVKGNLRRWNAELIALDATSQGLVTDALASIRTLLLLHRQAEVVERHGRLNQRLAWLESRSAVLPELPRQLVEPVGLTLLLLLLLLPAVRSSGPQSLPWLALVTVALLRLAQPLQELWRCVNLLQGSLPLQQEVLQLLALKAETTAEPMAAAATLSLGLMSDSTSQPRRLAWSFMSYRLYCTLAWYGSRALR